jgi:hypothetical protein
MQALYALDATRDAKSKLNHPPSSRTASKILPQTARTIHTLTMSSPSHRRQRSSQSGTPKRTSQRNSSALPSSPPDPAATQLQNEAASSQGGTPRRGVPSSSPMNYRSSPADIARANRERDVSSPLRQMTNTQTTGDGDRTPRASANGLIGGTFTSTSSSGEC